MKNKICKRCRKRKPLTEYYRGDSYADGRNTRCKACCAEVRGATISRTENKPWSSNALTTLRTEKRSAQLEQEYPKALREYTREYYWPNRKKMLKYGRRYREARKAQSTPRRSISTPCSRPTTGSAAD